MNDKVTVTSEDFVQMVAELKDDVRDLKEALIETFGDYLGFVETQEESEDGR